MGEFLRIYKSDLSDRELMRFWAMVCASGRDRAVTYCMPPVDGPAFCRWMRQDDVHPWIVLFRGAPCGLVYLTDLQGKSARVHFCTLPMGTARTSGRLPVVVGFGLFSLASMLWETTAGGSFRLDTVIGVTPVCNRAAVKFIHRLGARDVAEVPGACWFCDTGENVPGLVTVYTRETLPARAAKL